MLSSDPATYMQVHVTFWLRSLLAAEVKLAPNLDL